METLDVPVVGVAFGVTGHDSLYGFMSWEAHGRVAGYDVVEQASHGDVRLLQFASRVTDSQRAALASNTGITLRSVYVIAGRDWLGTEPPPLSRGHRSTV